VGYFLSVVHCDHASILHRYGDEASDVRQMPNYVAMATEVNQE